VQLTPRYDGPPLLRLDGRFTDPGPPLLRQRRRLADTLAKLDAEQWAAPTRCEGWSVQDVIAHLNTTNQFFAISISAGLAGEPTRFLATFDPVASPAEMVAKARSQTTAEVLDAFVTSTDGLARAVAGLDEVGWATLGEAPPGHVSLRAVALHALWDAWIHERDVLLPLGLPIVEEADEISDSLRYAAALGPAFATTLGSTRCGAIGVDVTGPDDRFTVEVGDVVVVRDGDAPAGAPTLTGSAVDLLEALSFRAPLPCSLAAEDHWLLGGLGQIFDRPA
jgi:uncharacterized protein (TIGR03083 family)